MSPVTPTPSRPSRPPIQMRLARVGEEAALEALQLRSSLVWEEYREQLLAHPDAIELPTSFITDERVRIADVEGADPGVATAGFSVVLPVETTVHELDGLFVDPAWMRQGIGRVLIADAASIARAAGATTLQVTANPRALPFYRAVGFVQTGITSTRFGDGILMTLALDP